MIKKLIFIFFLSYTCIISKSQETTFSKFFNLTNGNEELENLFLFDDDIYIQGAGINFPDTGGYNHKNYCFKFNNENRIEEFKSTINSNVWVTGNSIVSDGEKLYTIGYNPYTSPSYWKMQEFDKGLNNINNSDYLFLPDSIAYCNAIELIDNYLYIIGSTSYGPWQVNYNDVILMKTDLNGNKIKETRFPEISEPPYMYACADIKKMTDGNLLVSAVQFFNNNEGSDGIHSIFIKVDDNLDTLWTKQYSYCTDLINYPMIAPTNDGGAIVTRSLYTYDFYHELPMDTLYKYGDYPVWLCKLDKNGNEEWMDTLWTYRYIPLLEYSDPEISTKRIITTKNNDIVICGSYKDFKPKSKYRAYIVRFDQTGKKLWEKVYEDNTLECRSGTFFDIKEAENGDLIAVGEYYDKNGSWNNEIAGWLLRVDKDGCLEPGCGIKDTLDLVTVHSEFYTDTEEIIDNEYVNGIDLFPNPTNNIINIILQEEKNISLEVLNIYGQIIDTISIEKEGQLNTSSYPAGMYILMDKTGQFEPRKFEVVR